MAPPRLTENARFVLICLLICAVSLVIGTSYFYRAFPEASIDFKVDRISSQPLAEKFLASQGIKTSGYFHASAFQYDDQSKVFIERELGLKKANALMRNRVKLWRWAHRWFKPQQREEVRVEITPRGQLASFSHTLPEDAPGADLQPDVARSIAESFLVLEAKHPVDSLEFLDIQSEKLAHRTDHSLTYRARDVDLNQGSYRVSVTVQGDRIGGYNEFLKIPEDWSRGYARLRSLNETATQSDLIIMALLGIGMIVVLGRQVRLKDVRLKTALTFALICFVLQFFSTLNEFPLAKYEFDTTGTYGAFWGRLILTAVFSALIYAAVLFLLTASAEPVYRQACPSRLSITRMFSWQAIRTRSFFIASLAGITLTFFFFAFEIGFYLLANKLGAWAPAEVPYSDLLNTRFPWIFVLLGGFFPAVSEEWMFRGFSVPYLQRLLGRRWIAVLLASLIWGFGHANYPNQPFFIRGLEVGIVGIILSWAMFRFGILAPLIAHYSIDAFYSAFLLLRSGNPYLVVSGAVTAGINLLPLLIAAGAYICTRKFQDESAVSNEGEGIAPALPPAAKPDTAIPLPAYKPLSRARTAWAFGLLAAGLLALLFRAPRFAESVQFRISASQAMQSARTFLSGLGFDVSGYRNNTQPQNRVDPMASQYIYSKAGIPGLNSLYGRQNVPMVWETRFYKPLQKEEYRVNINPEDGRIVAFRHYLSEEEPGMSIPSGRAEQIAASFAAGKGYDLTKYRLKETVSERQKQRRDTVFVWEALPGTNGAIAEARLSLRAGIFGKSIGEWNQFIKIPEDWKRSRQSRNLYGIAAAGIRTVFAILMIALAMYILAKATLRGFVRWGLAAKIGAIAMVLELLNVANRIPLITFQYDTRVDTGVYLVTSLAQELLLLIGIGLAAALAVALVMACYPDAPAVLLKSGRIAWGRDGAIAVAATLGIYLVVQWLVSQLHYYAHSLMVAPDLSTPENIGAYVPLISDIHDVILSALFFSAVVAFAIHLWSRLAHRPFWRAILLLSLFFCLIPSTAKRVPEVFVEAIPSVLLVAIACLLVMIFLRNNYFAYLVCAAALSLARISLWTLSQGNPGLIIQGGLIWALMLSGLVFMARRSRPADGTYPMI